MVYQKLSMNELKNIHPGEAITIATTMAIIVAALMAVVVYRIFRADKATIQIPGGWKFDWK